MHWKQPALLETKEKKNDKEDEMQVVLRKFENGAQGCA